MLQIWNPSYFPIGKSPVYSQLPFRSEVVNISLTTGCAMKTNGALGTEILFESVEVDGVKVPGRVGLMSVQYFIYTYLTLSSGLLSLFLVNTCLIVFHLSENITYGVVASRYFLQSCLPSSSVSLSSLSPLARPKHVTTLPSSQFSPPSPRQGSSS